MKTVLATLLALIIAIGGGAASVWFLLEEAPAADGLNIGPWIAYPSLGTRDADPYSRARFVRRGGVPMGQAEGIVFTARTDSNQQTLVSGCTYRLDGPMPVARFWTLHAVDNSGRPLPEFEGRPAALQAMQVQREADNSFTITASSQAHPGNWLAITRPGPYQLLLTLLDTPISTGAAVEEIRLPTITRVSCDV
ncbi:DUF1214 domain-containing protein [Nitratireductor sp. CH_MIT9313-5]|jgi:hypothetical protein|uniref:DUF1214 domain-containing protein n=1 Tax=Nitratireductor sp. CH_MIT9313-5 TaxID=3107764 RepID=UPI00300A81AC